MECRQGRSNRSVNEFSSEKALRKALSNEDYSSQTEHNSCSDWRLADVREPSEPQTIDQEIKRLLVLKSYKILEEETDEASRNTFNGLASMAKNSFNTAGCISLVDLGRQWFLASTLEGMTETPRIDSFCAHTILSKEPIFVVPDTTKDERFAQNSFVVGEPHLRFYAGVPLLVPEGYKVGALCIADTKPRPEGLTESEIESLQSLGKLAVAALVNHRTIVRQREQLRTSSQASAAMAHSLLTPLNGIQLSLSILRQESDLASKMTPGQRECLATAHTCAAVMETSCRGIRQEETQSDISTASAETGPETRVSGASFDLRNMTKRLSSVMDGIAPQVSLTIQVDPSIPDYIAAEEVEVFRAAMSLIAYSSTRASSVCIKFRIVDSRLRLECCDSGPSPPAEEHEYFEGLDTQNYRICDISLTAKRIKSLGGSSGVIIQEDRTACFRFEIPLIHPAEPSEAPSEPLVPHHKKKTALVIDDSQVVRKVLARALTCLDYEVVQAEDGMGGLQCLQERSYDLVLCDFLMPVMDGMDCIREYRAWERKHRPDSHQYIVGMSAHASEKDVEAAFRLGMNVYKSKPIKIDDLKELHCKKRSKHASLNEDMLGPPSKRPRAIGAPHKEAFLVATDKQSESGFRDCFQERDCEAVFVSSRDEAMRLLMSRNWSAVFLDVDVAGIDGIGCAKEFRDWERKNRVHRQHNLCLMGEVYHDISLDPSTISAVHLPESVAKVLGKPVCSVALGDFVEAVKNTTADVLPRKMEASDIVTR